MIFLIPMINNQENRINQANHGSEQKAEFALLSIKLILFKRINNL